VARNYQRSNAKEVQWEEISTALNEAFGLFILVFLCVFLPFGAYMPVWLLMVIGILPGLGIAKLFGILFGQVLIDQERFKEEELRGGKSVIGVPPDRSSYHQALREAEKSGKKILDKYLVGFEVDTGKPLWVTNEEMCAHGCVFAKTGVGKTLWLESIMLQQLARGRASGCTFIDAKRDSGTLAHIIFMALLTGRIEDLIVIDPLDPVHSYNFVLTHQRADVKARKILRAGLPPISDKSEAKHYDRLAADSVYRVVRAIESLGRAWSVRDVAVALSAFNVAYPQLRTLLSEVGARHALVELGHLASSYRGHNGSIDVQRITDNLRGIASELHSISSGDSGKIFCTRHTDLNLTEAILQGKIVYFMLPRLEEAEGAARMTKVFREDIEVSIGEITSSRMHHLEDPHIVFIDEGSSTFGPTWANLFELARKGRFSLLFGAQSAGGLADEALGLSEAFYERVMANVNLKVMMRVGDNRTAQDLTEWMGKVSTTKKTVGSGLSSGRSSDIYGGVVDAGGKRTGSETLTVSISEDEEDLVSAEELKHEMSSEKGLALFDLGDGKIYKGRSLWFDADIPERWEGREFLTRLERLENDNLGLSTWVDQQILNLEQGEIDRGSSRDSKGKKVSEASVKSEQAPKTNHEVEGQGKFKIIPGKRSRSGSVTFLAKEQDAEKISTKGSLTGTAQGRLIIQ
jgi:hypothetical protein